MQSKSAALRQEIESSLASRIPAALSPQAVQAPRLLPIGNDAVNVLLGGGLPIGGICEFTGPASAGRTSLALSVLSEATVDSACAYIDVSDSLDARSAAAAGVQLKNLLWVRFSETEVQRPSLTQPAQTQSAAAPSRDKKADRSTHHHGIRHPRTETKGIDRDLEKILVQKAEARRNGHWQVYTHALDRHDPEPISSMSGWQSRPVLTPDHRWVLFLDQALPNAQRTLYRIPSQGGLPEAVPSQEDLQNFRCPVFSGSCVVRTKAANGQGVYSALDPLTGRGAALFREPSGWAFGQDWDLSQDGSTLVVYADTAYGLPLHTVSLKTGRVKDIAYRPTSRMVGVNWASGGDGFLVSCTEPSEPSENSLFYVNLAGKSVLLRTTSVETWAVPSPDGRWIAFIDRSLDSNVWLLQAK